MKRSQRKVVKVMTGTDIPLCSPSHPYAMAVQVKKVLDRISKSADSEFEYSCNSPAGIEVFEKYGRGVLGLTIIYYINGAKASHEAVKADMERATEYVNQLTTTNNGDN